MRNKVSFLIIFLFTLTILFQACESEDSLNYQRYYVNGKGIYEKHCQGCHGSEGEGLGKLYPPLTDTAYLIQNKQALSCIIRNGQNEIITINNVSYDSPMPGNTSLADIDIAQVIVYITNSFGNNQGFYDASKVTSDLKNCN